MFIQTEPTPNPATLKFLPGRTVIASGTANFTEAETAARLSPLAERLFSLPEVTGVFLGADFITVTKDGAGDWYQLKPAILTLIMEHFAAGRPVLLAAVDSAVAGASQEDEDEVVSQIKELLETRVRPAVAQDGGDIIFHNFEDGVVISTCRVPARAARARPRHSRRGSRICSGITSPRSWRCARFERARCALARPSKSDPSGEFPTCNGDHLGGG